MSTPTIEKKNFALRVFHEKVSNISDAAMSETSIREIVNLPEGAKASEAVYCNAKILECECACERGKVIVTGTASCCALWKDQDDCFKAARIVPDFRDRWIWKKLLQVRKPAADHS